MLIQRKYSLFFVTRLINNGLVGLREIILQSRENNFTYDKTLDLLVQINEEMSDKKQTVKMAGILPPRSNKPNNNNKTSSSPDQIKYCYNYNESGECRFGASCIYSHMTDPNHVTREPREKPTKDNTHQSLPKHVNRSNRTSNGEEKFRVHLRARLPKLDSIRQTNQMIVHLLNQSL